MKKLVTTLLGITTLGFVGISQCGKTLSFISSRTEYLDSSMNVQRTQDEKTFIEFTSTGISITPGGRDAMIGTISSNDCKWTKPFKEGKSVIKGILKDSDHGSDTKTVTITLEGKDGKVTLLFEAAERPDQKIRVVADKFEEKKQ